MVERKTTPQSAADNLVKLRSPQPEDETGEGVRSSSEASLRQRLTRLGRLIDAHPDALWLTDQDGVVLEANRPAAALMGLGVEEMIGAGFVDLIPSGLARTHRRRVEDVVQTGLPVFYVHSREDRDIEFHLYAAPGSGGEVENLVIVGRDVTARRRAEEPVPEPEENLRQLTVNLRETYVLLQVDPPGVVLVSPSFEEVFQLSVEDLMANPWALTELIHPDDLNLLRDLCVQWRHQPQSFEFEYRIMPPDGQVRWIVSRGFPIIDQTGRPNRLATVSEDITDRKLVEEARRESDRRYRALFEGSRDGVLSLDLEGRILTANPAAARILGYDDPRELVGLPAETIHQEPARRTQMISRLREQGFLDEVELAFKRRDGGVVYVMGSATVDFDAAGRPTGHSFIFSDVTRRKMAEEALLANQRQLSALAAELAMIEERERRRIASNLHDRVGTNLFSAKIK
ncbi:MAG: PAS domain S-box protein, partial [Proteobacteria bacterium]|nr:PAS domain S-box protein [Pseudomonadota bacterium]